MYVESYCGTISMDAVLSALCPPASIAQIGKVFTPGLMSAGTSTSMSNVHGGPPQAGHRSTVSTASPKMCRSAKALLVLLAGSLPPRTDRMHANGT